MERNFPAPEKPSQPTEKAGEKSKSKRQSRRALVPGAQVAEVKAEPKTPAKAEAPAPKVPLRELFASNDDSKKEDAPAEKTPTDADVKSGEKSSKKPSAPELDDEQAAQSVEDEPATDTAETLSDDDADTSAEAPLEIPAVPELETAPAAIASEGLLVIERDQQDYSHPEGVTETAGEAPAEDEPAPIVAPPIMFDIPLQKFEQPAEATVPEVPGTPEAASAELPPFIPLTEVTPVAEQSISTEDLEALTPVLHQTRVSELEPQLEQEQHTVKKAVTESRAATEKRAEERKKAEDERAAEKRGLSRGVTSGAFVGYLVGRRRGRMNAERTAKQELKKRDKKIESLETAGVTTKEHRTVLSNTVERLQSRVRSIEERARSVVKRAEKPESKRREQAAPAVRETAPISKNTEVITSPEHITPKPTPGAESIMDQTYEAPEGKRFETSAWHRYEVDAQTGKLVEDPELVYGEEFKKELKQERFQVHKEPTAAMHIGHAVVLNSRDNTPSSTVVDLVGTNSQANLQPELNPYRPPRQKVVPKQIISEVVGYTHQPVIWLAAGIIVILLFVTGILH